MKLEDFFILIAKHRGAVITITIVAVLTVLLINQALGVIFKVELMQDPCSLCESFIKGNQAPLNLSILNMS